MKKFSALFCIAILTLVIILGCSTHNSKPQTVRHIILWTLNDSLSSQEKMDLIKSTIADVAQLEKSIPGIISTKILYEGHLESSNCDFMFDFYFESEEALKSYSNNPEHLKMAAKLKPYIKSRTCLDLLE